MGSAIEFEFKGNLAQLRRDLGEATRLAKQAAGQVGRETTNGFNNGISGLFKRTPERRAERALGGLGTALATGDIALGLASFAEKITGFGLVAGVAVGVAIGAFEKFRHQINEASKSYDVLSSVLRRPLSLQADLGPEGITKELEDLSKATDDLSDKRKKSALARGFLGGDVFGLLANKNFKQGQALEESEKRQAELSAKRADKELQIANLKLKAAQGSEQEAALTKITLEAEEKRAALLLNRGGNLFDLFKSKSAIDVEEQAEKLKVIGKPLQELLDAPEPSPIGDLARAVPGGRLAELGESQELVNQIERNRLNDLKQRLGIPSDAAFDPTTGEMTIDKLGFKRTQTVPGARGGGGYERWEGIGTGIDGIKQGIDLLNQKIDQYWS